MINTMMFGDTNELPQASRRLVADDNMLVSHANLIICLDEVTGLKKYIKLMRTA